jgi:hypothetical protein
MRVGVFADQQITHIKLSYGPQFRDLCLPHVNIFSAAASYSIEGFLPGIVVRDA